MREGVIMEKERQSPDLNIRQWLRCPNCTWTSFRYRKRSNDYICIHCGAIFKIEQDMKRTKLVQPPVFNPPKIKGR